MTPSKAHSAKNNNSGGSNVPHYEQKILNTSSVGILITRISDGTILYANKAIAGLLKISDIESIIGAPVPNFYWDADERKVVVGRFRAEGSVVNYPLRARRSDDSMIWVSISIWPFEFEGEQVLLSEIIDISERQKAEIELQKEKVFSDTVINGLAGAFFLFDTQGNMVRWNEEYERVTGYTTKEIAARNALDPIADEDKENTAAIIERAFTEGQGSVEAHFVNRDGRRIPYYFVGRRLQLGDQLYLAGTGIDITERKQAEKALAEEQQQMQAIMNNLPAHIYFKDLESRFIRISNSLALSFGLSDPAQAIGKTDFVFFTEEHARQAYDDEQAIIRTGQPLTKEEKETIANQADAWVSTIKLPRFDEEGNIIGTFGISTDITEHKNLEQQKQAAFERRGYEVQVGTEISQGIAAASELSDLFDRVVTLTKERLDYYHTQLLRYDASQDAVVLINGYGEIGQKMLASGHKLPMGIGLIGTAAASGQTILRSTLTDDPDWQPNQLLPDTRGEIAVPIKWQDTILGVLDVQSNQAGALTEDDRLLLEGLCGQIAIAMHNSELVETVRQNEARLAEALRMAKLAYWDHDLATNQFQFNDQFYAICHTTVEQEGGYAMSPERYTERFIHPDDRAMTSQAIAAGMQSTDRHFSSKYDQRLIYLDGSGIGHMTIETNIERDENGNIIRVYGSYQDITERKQAEETLRINEARLAQALRIARLAYWEYDVEKDIFTLNDQLYSIFHTTAEKAGGYQLSSARYTELFVHPDDMGLVGKEIGKALSLTERVYNTSIDHRILYADGGVGYITVKLTVERDENGKITRFFGANQDITEQRKAQVELAERLEEVNRLYQSMSHESWKTYRETENLPAGFVYDQAGIKPVDDAVLADELFANIPMRLLGGEVVGTLTVANDPLHPTSPEDYVFLQQVSDQIALALESARLFEQTQSALAQSEKLFKASSQLTQAADLQELVEIAAKTMNIPVVNRAILDVFNYNSAGDLESMDVAATWWNGTGHEPTPIGMHYSIETLRVMSLFISPTPVFFSDAFSDERFDQSALQVAKSLSLRSGAVLPLHGRTRQIGILFMEAEEPHTFTREEVRLFEALAPQITTVLENRRQFERAQKQADRESTLNLISQKIQSATSVEAVLQIAARELGHALGAPRTIAQLSIKDKK